MDLVCRYSDIDCVRNVVAGRIYGLVSCYLNSLFFLYAMERGSIFRVGPNLEPNSQGGVDTFARWVPRCIY